jgi:hypothetical protein
LLKYAYANAVVRMKGKKQTIKGEIITKSISPKKRRPK